ncbi:unnamed protein product [Moneuplotes crassus]|uniref:Uncharacterized protein n=1 Tax=Euplotes crassus TaxID=5936 RepID=A0AAD1YAH5_EUPCR|nr:unnamed protein product [Moneuplotes crassus]
MEEYPCNIKSLNQAEYGDIPGDFSESPGSDRKKISKNSSYAGNKDLKLNANKKNTMGLIKQILKNNPRVADKDDNKKLDGIMSSFVYLKEDKDSDLDMYSFAPNRQLVVNKHLNSKSIDFINSNPEDKQIYSGINLSKWINRMKDLKQKRTDQKRYNNINLKSNIYHSKSKSKKKQRITLSPKKVVRKKIHTPSDSFKIAHAKIQNEYNNEYSRQTDCRNKRLKSNSISHLPLRKSHSSSDSHEMAQKERNRLKNHQNPRSDYPSVFIPKRVQNVINLKPTQSPVKLPNITINTNLKTALKLL